MTMFKRSASALDWEASAVQMQAQSERRAWGVAKGASAIALVCAGALAVLVPFYRVVPIPIEVNQLTGDAQVIDVLGPKAVKVSETIDKHWLTTYVERRERYFWPFLQMDYDTVRTMSDGAAKTEFERIFDGPDALDKVLGAETQREIKILSATLPPGEPGRAVVRFKRTTTTRGLVEPQACFMATIAYRYQPPMVVKEREAVMNPLGFKVVTYRRDTDFGPCPSTATADTAPSVMSAAASVMTASPGAAASAPAAIPRIHAGGRP